MNLFEVTIPTVFSIKRKIGDETDQVEAKKIMVEEKLNVCDSCVKLFTSKYFNVFIKAYVNRINSNKEKLILKSKNTKLKKISHN